MNVLVTDEECATALLAQREGVARSS
jgi:DNA-binding transcriptional regulator LsrR (DeoR family)